jgi:tricorn protease
MVEWHPDGKQLLIASRKESGSGRYNQLYLVSMEGGLTKKLPMAYGELGSFSPDGKKIAYVTRITENYPFKRYRGGYASDVIVFDLAGSTAENITTNAATDGKPAWHGEDIYYVSDAGPNKRRNIWVYHTNNKTKQQITNLESVDINHMSIGATDLVFEAGGMLYVMNLTTKQYAPIQVDIVADVASTMPHLVKTTDMIHSFTLSPDGKRALFEARGEIFNLPAEHGYVLNTTNSSGAFDRLPSWSPDGKFVAYWSDKSGENELYLKSADGKTPEKALTHRSGGFGFSLSASGG